MSIQLVRGDAAHLPLPDGSVDLVVTSPPYFALRSYQDGGEHYSGQIGSEATPAEFVDALVACTAEWVRVLKPSGSIFVNLGDKYSTGNSGQSGLAELGERWAGGGHSDGKAKRPSAAVPGFKPKSLLGLPWRYALRCIDDLGLILRAEVIWSKPNGLPESVTDRVRRSHEQWFHFVQRPRYYTAVDTIREDHQPQSLARTQRNRFAPDLSQVGVGGPNTLNPADACNPLGKLPGSVWSIPSQPLTVPKFEGLEPGQPIAYLWTDDEAQEWVTRWPGRSLRPLPDHFAAFPMEWPRRLILGWSPSGICTGCGEGRRPVTSTALAVLNRGDVGSRGSHFNGSHDAHKHNRMGQETVYGRSEVTVTGECCGCTDTSAPTRASVILDPFGGTGTTALMADVLGRHGVSVDMSADYCRLARWRTSDPGERARAMQVDKPDPVMDGQTTIFDML